ncbi:hypothetical protein LZ32DRAFT_600655, partial [Colletotrichum eremochloae]
MTRPPPFHLLPFFLLSLALSVCLSGRLSPGRMVKIHFASDIEGGAQTTYVVGYSSSTRHVTRPQTS